MAVSHVLRDARKTIGITIEWFGPHNKRETAIEYNVILIRYILHRAGRGRELFLLSKYSYLYESEW